VQLVRLAPTLVCATVVCTFARPLLADTSASERASKKSTYGELVRKGARFVLSDPSPEPVGPAKIVIETYDVRHIGTADVARLRWSLSDSGSKRDIGDSGSGMYTQLAVTPAGLYLLDADQDDAAVAQALKRKPSRSDPPREYKASKKNDGRYLRVQQDGDATIVCMGIEPLPGAGDCDDVCEAELCISSARGVISLHGRWAPDGRTFDAAR
jgi:hypothetical protein